MHDPRAEYPFVYKNYIAMQSPLVTSDIPQSVRDALNTAARYDRTRGQPGGDMWDKNRRTLRDWVEEFNKPQDNEYVWTSIPNKVTEVLKSLGYDGVIDSSGKAGGAVHPVYIPFTDTQIKSAIGNKGDFDINKKNISYSLTTGRADRFGLQLPDESPPVIQLSTFTADSPTEFTKAQAETAIGKARELVSDALGLQINVVHSSDIPAPVKAQLPAGKYPKGFNYDGQVYLVADHLDNARDAQINFAHEVIGHAGVEGILSKDDWQSLQNRFSILKRSADKEFQGILKEVHRRYADRQGNIDPVRELKEFIALAAESREKSGTVDTFIRKVAEFLQKALRALGFNRPFSMTDIHALLSASERYLKGTEVSRGTLTPAPVFSQDKNRRDWTIKPGDGMATAIWKLLAQSDEIFTYPVSNERSMAGIVRDTNSQMRVERTKQTPKPGTAKKYQVTDFYTITMPDGKEAGVTQYANGEVHLNAALLERSRSLGTALYHAVANYAHNNRLVFIGDPAGLSPDALARRTENMLASALKFGTTDHMAPHVDQTKQGPRPLNWKTGDSDHNLRELILTSYANVKKALPEIDDYQYNFARNEFINTKSNETVDEATLASLVARAEKAGERTRAGSRTLKRAILTHSISRLPRSERSEVLAEVSRQLQHGVAESLRSVSYSQAPQT